MGKSHLFDRELVFADASLSVAAARSSNIKLDPAAEARRILGAFPGSRVTIEELAEAIAHMDRRDKAMASHQGVPADMLTDAGQLDPHTVRP